MKPNQSIEVERNQRKITNVWFDQLMALINLSRKNKDSSWSFI